MHESTISRVTTNKYVETPQGLFELKYFFHSGIASDTGEMVSSVSIKKKIRDMVAAEEASKPLSDQDVALVLRGRGSPSPGGRWPSTGRSSASCPPISGGSPPRSGERAQRRADSGAAPRACASSSSPACRARGGATPSSASRTWATSAWTTCPPPSSPPSPSCAPTRSRDIRMIALGVDIREGEYLAHLLETLAELRAQGHKRRGPVPGGGGRDAGAALPGDTAPSSPGRRGQRARRHSRRAPHLSTPARRARIASSTPPGCPCTSSRSGSSRATAPSGRGTPSPCP